MVSDPLSLSHRARGFQPGTILQTEGKMNISCPTMPCTREALIPEEGVGPLTQQTPSTSRGPSIGVPWKQSSDGAQRDIRRLGHREWGFSINLTKWQRKTSLQGVLRGTFRESFCL